METDDHSSLQVNTNVYEQYSFYLFVIGDEVYVYIVLMLDKAGHHERWGIVKEGGKGRRKKKHYIVYYGLILLKKRTKQLVYPLQKFHITFHI
jgi:hypothetical protein